MIKSMDICKILSELTFCLLNLHDTYNDTHSKNFTNINSLILIAIFGGKYDHCLHSVVREIKA